MKIEVIGGGLVGLMAANLLLKNDFDVELVEPHPPCASWKSMENTIRYSALSPVSIQWLKALGVWEKICAQKQLFGQCQQMKIWENNASQPLVFDGKKIAQVPLGVIANNECLRKILWENFQQQKIYYSNINASRQGVLIIAADGARSMTREKSRISCKIKDYGQKAIIANIQTTKPHSNIARQWFLLNGVVAFLPLAHPNQISLVWSLEENNADKIFECQPLEFEKVLQEAVGECALEECGKLTLISDRQIFPLRMQMAKKYIDDKLVLIGDCAHTVHPLAGFGVNMGICDAAALVKILVNARRQARDIGSPAVLRQYERERLPENLFMQQVIDSFTQPALRKWGVGITRKSSFLSNFFMHWMSEYGHQNVII